MAEIWLVERGDLPYLWPTLWPIIDEYGKNGVVEFYDHDSLLEACYTGIYDVWVAVNQGAIEGISICSKITYPKKAFYKILWMGGKGTLKYFRKGLKKIEQYAVLHGCSEVNFEGRWDKIYTHCGYLRSSRAKYVKDVRILHN